MQVTSSAIFCVDADGFPYTGYYQDTSCYVPACDSDAMTSYCNPDTVYCKEEGDVGCTIDDGSCSTNFLS